MALLLTKTTAGVNNTFSTLRLFLYIRRPFFAFNTRAQEKEYKRCYELLEINEDCDQEQIRLAYLRLVKRYHPDSGTPEADADKFHEIDKAFKTLINKKSKERWDYSSEEGTIVEEQDIKHTAPQHRQYLSYDGVGHGNPFQRQKQYTKMRAMQAAENVHNHRVAKYGAVAEQNSLLDKNATSYQNVKHKIKTKYGFDRLVEDLIQESMSKGEFNNLSGCGKPLPTHTNRNPYVDFVTHKLNEVLIDNGFTPEWIVLQKEIRTEARQLRKNLFIERQYFGPYPLDVEENIKWSDIVYKKYQDVVENLNRKINKFNLLVPILDKQMVGICLEREAQRAIVQGKSCRDVLQLGDAGTNKREEEKDNSGANIFAIFESIFKTNK